MWRFREGRGGVYSWDKLIQEGLWQRMYSGRGPVVGPKFVKKVLRIFEVFRNVLNQNYNDNETGTKGDTGEKARLGVLIP